MFYSSLRKAALSWVTALAVAGSVYSCGSSSDEGAGATANGTGKANGESCAAGSECISGVCSGGVCEGNGTGAPAGAACSDGSECASGSCTGGICDAGSNLPDGSSCADATECASGACTNGVCGDGSSSGSGGTSGTSGSGGTSGTVTGPGAPGSDCTTGGECQSGFCVDGKCGEIGTGTGTTTTGPQWDGSGSGFRPLTPGCGPSTADQCTGECEQSGGDPDVTVIRPPATLCFYSPDDLTPDDPAVVIEQSIETLDGVTYVHLRITFDPSFTDNTYGENSDPGWKLRGGIHEYGHTFDPDLVKSDHTELLITDGSGMTVMSFHVDYISADPTEECGYGSLGVSGGDGSVTLGDPSYILAVTTSEERNLNGCGYCTSDACGSTGDCTVHSPATDENFTPNDLTPNWDYRNVYEVWIDAAAFGDAGFGQAYMTYVHASPNKSTLVTLDVTPAPCPPEWDEPYCPPSVTQEGGDCFGTPTGEGGAGGGGGGGYGNPCPVNYQVYVTTEGASTCTPIPYANYPGMTPCPEGYMLDLATEGQYCVPAP